MHFNLILFLLKIRIIAIRTKSKHQTKKENRPKWVNRYKYSK